MQVESLAFVDTGLGFSQATNNMKVNPGHRVRAGTGCALVVYQSGPQWKMCDDQMAVVVSDVSAGSLKDSPSPVAGAIDADFILQGVVIGAGTGMAIALSNHHANTVSP